MRAQASLTQRNLMKDNITYHDEAALLDRLINGVNDHRQFVFLCGSGLTCPIGDKPGVLSVRGIIDLVRAELSGDVGVLNQLDEEIAGKPTDEYQISFQHLGGRRAPGCASRIIRKAVLAARLSSAHHQDVAKKLIKDDYIKTAECEALCEVLERDINHWSIRPGLSALGSILADYSGTFGGSVITTNFDPLLEVSIGLANGIAQTWGLSGDAPTHWPKTPADTCRILHIHGYWSNTDTLHTKLVMEHERPNLEVELGNIVRERVLVVIGYGGWDDALVRVLLRATHDVSAQTNVLWAFHSKSQDEIYRRNQHLLERLLQGVGGTRVFFYKGIDTDRFFPSLLTRLRSIRSGDGGIPVGTIQPTHGGLTPAAPQVGPPATMGPAESARPVNKKKTSEPLVKDLTADFISALRERESELSVISGSGATLSDQGVQEPNFLLFEREGTVVLVVSPSEGSVDEYRLQKTTEPQIKATLLSKDRVKALGFAEGKVHPMFSDSAGKIARVFWDSSLLVQAILFPESKMALPLSQKAGAEQKVLASIDSILTQLIRVHGRDKVVYASVSATKGPNKPNQVLAKLLATTPYITRFAPTPSNQLHLGNARTALAAYMLGLKDKQRARFFLRIDDTDHERSLPHLVAKIKEEVRWLGLEWDNTSEIFHQSETFETYQRLLRILTLAEFTEQHEGGDIYLKSLPLDHYYCVYYDWRNGATVTHQPPLAFDEQTRKLVPKPIKLFRPDPWNAYYQYAGLVDDVRCLYGTRHLTYVVRDNGQLFLTRVQAHIRYALELARQKLEANSEAQRLFLECNIDSHRPIQAPSNERRMKALSLKNSHLSI